MHRFGPSWPFLAARGARADVDGLGMAHTRAPHRPQKLFPRHLRVLNGGMTATVIYVDADACPVKEEAVRVAERHGLVIHFVSNTWMRLPESPLVHRMLVADGCDAADDWIAARIGPRDIAVTADIPLAARCLKAGARVIGPSGKPFTETSIGMALAMRDLSRHLRETGQSKGYNASFTRQDRSLFLQALEEAVQAIRRQA
jgi:uncharacterized protein YaiI (UPF0178 family)